MNINEVGNNHATLAELINVLQHYTVLRNVDTINKINSIKNAIKYEICKSL